MATDTKDAQQRAEASFKKKELQAREASKAMAEYEAGRVAEREKTARLKLLREAKERADAAAALAAKEAAAANPAAVAHPLAAKRKAPGAAKKPAVRVAGRRSS